MNEESVEVRREPADERCVATHLHHDRGFAEAGDELDRPEPGGRPTLAYERDNRRSSVPRRLPYLRTTTRAAISSLVALTWIVLSVWISRGWIDDLARVVTMPLALLIVFGIAWIPGFLNMQLLMSLLLDRPPRLRELGEELPDVTVLIAAWNEADTIERTISSVLEQEYPFAEVRVLVIDDGSTDRTGHIVAALAELDDRVEIMSVPHGGKAAALNAGLASTTDWIVATVDADTHLHPQALQRAVTRMLLQPHCVAVAGSLLVRNDDVNLLTRTQAYDYMLAISSVKREQALLQSTLVAQGAFSVYMGSAIAAAGGWTDSVGEDIVLTWGLLERGGSTSFEATAVAYTEVPDRLIDFVRQRRRWARGMFEGIKSHGMQLLRSRRMVARSIAGNLAFPLVDLAFTFAFIPGLVLAFTGNFLIVGPMTLAVLPISMLIALTMRSRQRRSLRAIGIDPPGHWSGFLMWFLCYQLLLSPISVAGYAQELTRRAKRW